MQFPQNRSKFKCSNIQSNKIIIINLTTIQTFKKCSFAKVRLIQNYVFKSNSWYPINFKICNHLTKILRFFFTKICIHKLIGNEFQSALLELLPFNIIILSVHLTSQVKTGSLNPQVVEVWAKSMTKWNRPVSATNGW